MHIGQEVTKMKDHCRSNEISSTVLSSPIREVICHLEYMSKMNAGNHIIFKTQL